jgi:DNA (cytosine-5)-methyltransferase 1
MVKTPSLFDENKDSNMKKFTFIDLFAGIGGTRIGFEKAGGECVFSSEWDKFAQETYQANFNETPEGDITKIKAEDIPSFDVLVAGFPCQPFSQAGKKKGFADTRGTLFFDIARIINHHRPKAFLLENVKRLKTHDKGRTLEVIKKVLKELGYNLSVKVLNAKDFGVPQNRERIFIAGFLGENNFSFPGPLNKKIKLGDILQDKVGDKYTISDKLWAGHKRRKKEHREKGYGFGYSLFNKESEYTSTISARYYKDGSEILVEQNNKNPRKLTPREAARLQGFPESFRIPVSDTQAYKQFGNSVCVPLIESIAQNMAKILDDIKVEEKNYNKVDIGKIKFSLITN